MGRRGLVNVRNAAPFKLVLFCGHPDVAAEPVTVSFFLDGRRLPSLRFLRRGFVERSFEPEAGETGVLLLEVSRTWRPSEVGLPRDRRELGIAVGPLARP
jgi:hypothetical protein